MELQEVVELAHGAGGAAMGKLIKEVILPLIERRRVHSGIGLDELDDGATIPLGGVNVVVTTDGHTVDPIFFPGGDIGRLAVSGTVNDLLMMGADPVAITCSMIVEEGFPIADLKRIIRSINDTCNEAGVALIAGDTKVMPRGRLDKIVLATTGIGIAKEGSVICDNGIKVGDKIILTGTVGDHGIALLAAREGISFDIRLKSDVAPLNETIKAALSVGGITAMKDPTRGGLAAALNDLAKKNRVSIWIKEESIPIRGEVVAASEMLGIDPLEVTCEGKAIIAVRPEKAEEVLEKVRATRYGRNASIIGEVRKERPGYVIMETVVGGKRIIEEPYGEPIPRVC
ncbi:MAG: hydrogenase expression/formation protein HypE [Candidatus Freyarchaeota archaeon]|nr:hydrogenase expression/formation protein HypE [Candidatus Jordarchaeia archaeon]